MELFIVKHFFAAIEISYFVSTYLNHLCLKRVTRLCKYANEEEGEKMKGRKDFHSNSN